MLSALAAGAAMQPPAPRKSAFSAPLRRQVRLGNRCSAALQIIPLELIQLLPAECLQIATGSGQA